MADQRLSADLIAAQVAYDAAESAVLAAHLPPVDEAELDRLRDVAIDMLGALIKLREAAGVTSRAAIEALRAAARET